MPPALPVVRVTAGGRNEGKTLLASRLIEELTKRGYAVAARPIPNGGPIGFSPQGTPSAAQ